MSVDAWVHSTRVGSVILYTISTLTILKCFPVPFCLINKLLVISVNVNIFPDTEVSAPVTVWVLLPPVLLILKPYSVPSPEVAVIIIFKIFFVVEIVSVLPE